MPPSSVCGTLLGAGVHFSRALTLSSHWLSVVDDAHSSLPPASTAREGLPRDPQNLSPLTRASLSFPFLLSGLTWLAA